MDQETRLSMMRYRWLMYSILALAYLIVYFHRLSLSVVAHDLVEEFQATASVMGLLGSVYFYCYALMQIPSGLLSDSLGPRKTVAFSLMISSLGSILFGLAPNLTVAFLGRVMVGLGVSMVFIPTMKILSQWFRVREFALMTGILNAVGGAGVLVATWVLALMVAVMGWRLSFELIGAFNFLLVVLAWLLVRDRPQDKGWTPLEAPASGGAGPVRIPLREGLRRVLTEKYFWPVAIWFFFDCGIFFGLGGLWGGPYLMDVYGLSKSEAGAVLSMIAWGMVFGSPLLGYLSDRVIRSRKRTMILCNVVLTAELIFLSVYPSGLPRPALYLVFLVFSVCSSAVVVIGFTTTKELFPLEITGTSVGSVNFFPFFGGAIFMPFLGRVLDLYPKSPAGAYSIDAYGLMMLILLGASVISLVCAFLMKETYPR